MARPIKNGLDYFPLDVDFDDKIHDLTAACGRNAKLIYIELLQRIYKTDTAQLDISSEIRILRIAKESEVTPAELQEILRTMVAVGLFDAKAFESGFLTSNGIKKRWDKVEDQRMIRRQWHDKKHGNAENSQISPNQEAAADDEGVLYDKTGTEQVQNTYKTPQSKGKESKGKERKVHHHHHNGGDDVDIHSDFKIEQSGMPEPSKESISQVYLRNAWGKNGILPVNAQKTLFEFIDRFGHASVIEGIDICTRAGPNCQNLRYLQGVIDPEFKRKNAERKSTTQKTDSTKTFLELTKDL